MNNQRQRFIDKVVLLTGGATGIGRATALAFAKEGAAVVIGDVNPEAQQTANAIKSAGGQALFVPTDVSNFDDVTQLVDTCVTHFGGLHCAFNNAGILPQTNLLHETPSDDFDRVMAINVKGIYNCLRAEISYMKDHGGGSIVNTSSVGGVIADPGMAPYVASKHAVVGFTKAAAIEYGSMGIRVNAIGPGFTATPMTQKWLDDPEFTEILKQGIAMGRPAQPEEMSGTVLHLCSDDASFTTGQLMIVDGGQTAH